MTAYKWHPPFKLTVLVLASASKARRSLLERARIPHLAIASGFDERSIKEKDPKQLVQSLALAKAETVARKLESDRSKDFYLNDINNILGCDSLFEFEGEIFEKPKSVKEAVERLKRMSSKSGFLHTGHALIMQTQEIGSKNRMIFSGLIKKVVSTHVSFSEISLEEIKAYVATGEPLKCAGGFALEGTGGKFIQRIDGCYSNVIGISLPWLRKALFSSNKETL